MDKRIFLVGLVFCLAGEARGETYPQSSASSEIGSAPSFQPLSNLMTTASSLPADGDAPTYSNPPYAPLIQPTIIGDPAWRIVPSPVCPEAMGKWKTVIDPKCTQGCTDIWNQALESCEAEFQGVNPGALDLCYNDAHRDSEQCQSSCVQMVKAPRSC